MIKGWQIPKTWCWSTIAGIASSQKNAVVDGPFGSNLKTSDYVEDGIPVLQGKNITNNEFKWFDIRFISEQKAVELSRSSVQIGDILIIKIGSIGYAAELNNLKHYPFAIIPANLAKLTIDKNIADKKYVLHWLATKSVKRHFDEIASKTAQPALSLGKIKELPIPLPPLAKQKRIAAILDKADSLRRKNQQAIQLADQFLRAVFLDMFGDPVTNSKGFPLGTIRDLTESANYGASAKASETEGEFPILRMGNITYQGGWDFSNLKYIDLSEKDEPKYLARKGDLLFNRTNSKELVGKTAVFEEEKPMAIAGYLIRVRSNENGNNYYISGYLNSKHGKKTLINMCKSIVGMANINAQEMQDIKMLIPPIELQNKYEQIVLSTKRRLKNLVASEIASEQLFGAISQKAFAGEL